MKNAILSLALLVSLSLTFSISCGSNSQPPSGALPTWHTGDTWTMKVSSNEIEYIQINTVTGEKVVNGIDCYTLTTQGNSTTMGNIYIGTMACDKTTMQLISSEFTFSFSFTDVTESTTTVNMSYNNSIKPYPLSEGKTWIVTVNTTTTDSLSGQNHTTTETVTYKVEKMEHIEVPAGMFQCFKIVVYDENNSVVSTSWNADEGWNVKSIDNVNGTTSELMSYSLAK